MKTNSFLVGLVMIFILSNHTNTQAQYSSWQYNAKIHNIEFSKIRYGLNKNDTTVIIGYLKRPTLIQGFSCAADWVHFSKDWKPVLFKLQKKASIHNFVYPENAWIRFKKDGIICAFPTETQIQGCNCMGSGGAKGIQTSFYPDGKLECFYSNSNILIGKIACKGGVFNNIILHQNGQLKECTLSNDQIIDGKNLKKGKRVRFDVNGKLQ
ncbi:MAG: hypothetical protein U0V04_00760 [Spirosomataceae bacterium]|jgi:hypothetical protein